MLHTPLNPMLNNATLAHKNRIGIYELDYGTGHVISFGFMQIRLLTISSSWSFLISY